MIIDVHDLNVAIGDRSIINDVCLHVSQGERVGLIGASGSGKSMIARTMLGLQPAYARVSGSITVAGHEIVGADDHDLANLRGRVAGMIFQNPTASLNPVLRVREQIALPLRLHYDLSREEILQRVLSILERVQLPRETASAFPHELSGGQQQRVAIATALVTSPRLIVADEPTTALDSITQRQIVDLLVSLVRDTSASLLFITHDFSVLAHAVERCYVIDAGRIVDEGATADLLVHPNTSQTRRLVSAAQALSLHGIHPDSPAPEAAVSSGQRADSQAGARSRTRDDNPRIARPERTGGDRGGLVSHRSISHGQS